MAFRYCGRLFVLKLIGRVSGRGSLAATQYCHLERRSGLAESAPQSKDLLSAGIAAALWEIAFLADEKQVSRLRVTVRERTVPLARDDSGKMAASKEARRLTHENR